MKNSLQTPLGDIIINVNGVQMSFRVEELPVKENAFDVDARFLLTPIIPKGITIPFAVQCKLTGEGLPQLELETGERYASAHIIKNCIDLSFGSYDDSDEDATYELTGTGWELLEMTCNTIKSVKYARFAIAWVNTKKKNYDDSWTWFAAEPPDLETQKG